MMTRKDPKVESLPRRNVPAVTDVGLLAAMERVTQLQERVAELEAAELPTVADVRAGRFRNEADPVDGPGTPLYDAVLAENGVPA